MFDKDIDSLAGKLHKVRASALIEEVRAAPKEGFEMGPGIFDWDRMSEEEKERCRAEARFVLKHFVSKVDCEKQIEVERQRLADEH